MEDKEQTTGYGKRPLWQWVLIYLIIGGVIYGLIYFVFSKKSGYNPSSNPPPQQNTQQTNPGY